MSAIRFINFLSMQNAMSMGLYSTARNRDLTTNEGRILFAVDSVYLRRPIEG
jgi:hypothetical protein